MKLFLDSNIIADWILVKNKVSKKVKDDLLSQRYHYMSHSYKLIEELIASEVATVTSQLAISEVFSVLSDDAINMKLYMKAIPTAVWMWITFRNRERLSEEESLELHEGILRKIDDLFSDTKVDLIEDEFNLEIYSYLVLRLGMKTHDAILLTTAILNEVNYFVTRDDRLIENTRRKFRDKFDVKLSKPINALNVVKSENSKYQGSI
jgi:predicted nucleic acid-binding protein